MTDSEWLSSDAAARKLGVKPQTLYAYVSRGMVRSEKIPGTRRSRFRRADVEKLAGRQRGGGRAGGLELIIETDLTYLDPAGVLAYRGWNVADAVKTATFEEVASWLWHGERQRVEFVTPRDLSRIARQLAGTLSGQPVMDRIRATVASVRRCDPFRDDRRPESVAAAGRAIVATMLDALPLVGEDAAGGSVAARLWPRLSAHPAKPRLVKLLDATLVMLADHEMAASTLAARVAASTWADPYLVVLAGLATLGGPLHGAASSQARRLLHEVHAEGISPAEAIASRLRNNELIPGFGHRVYEHNDPRCDVLLELLAAIKREPAEEELLVIMRERGLPFPNIDFAIASFAERYDMIDNAGEVIFAVARTAGWLAHAIEEYRYRLRYRPRAVYTGPTMMDA
ncbi:MAG TPA: citrate/2-methylcitrate synthase [Acidimicrobiales bacterium]|nr:citrate/2-methylcitrate synthase [Acidimicrobiales bacterium]